MMARVLGVSPRSYYDYRHNKYNKRETKKGYFLAYGRYGSPRLCVELRKKDVLISQTTTAKYMRELGLQSKLTKKFKVTTDSNHKLNIAPNLVNRNFSPYSSSMIWVSDITYIYTSQGFIYLTTVIDLYDRKVIGWSISRDMTKEQTVIKAFNMAKKNRQIVKGMIFHSDRGAQYASNDFVEILKSNKIVQSMSRKGNCWDNAVAESFFKSLKCEMIYGSKLTSAKEMELQVFEYIEIWYNKVRRHSAIENLNVN